LVLVLVNTTGKVIEYAVHIILFINAHLELKPIQAHKTHSQWMN